MSIQHFSLQLLMEHLIKFSSCLLSILMLFPLHLQLELCGETVVDYADLKYGSSETVPNPISNIYLSQLSLLVQLKLRIGFGLAVSASR